jgi:predicted secreted protein
MKTILSASAALLLAVGVWAGEAVAPSSQKSEISVGEVLSITLPCNATTGYSWQLKSINRKVALPTGPVQENAPKSGALGAGGSCVFNVQGVKAGKTKAILEYRRPWEKGKPAKTFTAEIKVLPKKT